MLKNPRGCSCFMIKTPLKLMKKSVTTPLFFIFMIILSYVLMLLLVFPCKQNILSLINCLVFLSQSWFIIDTIMLGLSVIFFAMSAFKDPGYLEKPKNATFLVITLIPFIILIDITPKL